MLPARPSQRPQEDFRAIRARLVLVCAAAIVVAANAAAWWLHASGSLRVVIAVASAIALLRLNVYWTRTRLIESLVHLPPDEQDRIIGTLPPDEQRLLLRVLHRESGENVRNA